MADLGKRINIQKKFKKHPSSQSSGMPLKSIKGISDINSVKFKTSRYTNTMTARPPAGTGATPTAFPLANEKAQGAGTSNPFYIWLLNNSITRSTAPLNETNGSYARMTIIATGTPSYKLTAGEQFYLYHPVTFKSLLLTCQVALTATDTLLRLESVSIQKGVDNFPSGSFLVKKNNIQSLHTSVVPIGTGNSIYLIYLTAQNNWYSSSMYYTDLGTSIGSETNEVSLRSSEYVATNNTIITKVTLLFYVDNTCDLEFGVYKIPNVNASTANVTWSQMTHTDINANYTADTTYIKEISVTGGNNITAGQGVGIVARNTSHSGLVRMYGKGFITLAGHPTA